LQPGQRRLLPNDGHAAPVRTRLRRERPARRGEIGDRQRAFRAQVLRRPRSDRPALSDRRAAQPAAAAHSDRRRGQRHEVNPSARTVARLIVGLHTSDPPTLAMAAAGLGAIAMLASYLPALRAARLEPTEALREE